jgi:hypothetical protein
VLGWVMVYSQQDYINARNSLDLLGAKLDAAKSDDSKSNKANKKTADLSSQLTTKARELSVIKFRSNIAMMVTVLISWNVLSSGYEGIVVAKLPFVPLPLIQAMSMRGLSGNDPTECNVYFILALCQVPFRCMDYFIMLSHLISANLLLI